MTLTDLLIFGSLGGLALYAYSQKRRADREAKRAGAAERESRDGWEQVALAHTKLAEVSEQNAALRSALNPQEGTTIVVYGYQETEDPFLGATEEL